MTFIICKFIHLLSFLLYFEIRSKFFRLHQRVRICVDKLGVFKNKSLLVEIRRLMRLSYQFWGRKIFRVEKCFLFDYPSIIMYNSKLPLLDQWKNRSQSIATKKSIKFS